MSTSPDKAVIAAVHPLAGGVAQFNGAMARAMARTSNVEVLSWRRLYPPLVYRGQLYDTSAPHPDGPVASFILDWHDPRTWRRAARRVAELEPAAVVLPWVHPVMAPPYRFLLTHVPRAATRVVICHNVAPHESVPGSRLASRAVLRHADVLVTHAPHQRGEIEALGLSSATVVEAFHPRFEAEDFAPPPSEDEVAMERHRQGDPDLLLLTFGAIRRYKGVDLALEALARVDPGLRVRLIVAGRSWGCADDLRGHAERLGLGDRVEFRDRFLTGEEAALLFSAADASLLPYRSATQSGVVQLSFAYGTPVIATRVGGLPAAVEHDVDGLLCEPASASLADAIEAMAVLHHGLRKGVWAGAGPTSFDRYCARIDEAVSKAAA